MPNWYCNFNIVIDYWFDLKFLCFDILLNSIGVKGGSVSKDCDCSVIDMNGFFVVFFRCVHFDSENLNAT